MGVQWCQRREGGGVIEGAFAATLTHAIPAGIFAASMLWWRFYTFYLYVAVGGFAAGDAAIRAIRKHEVPVGAVESRRR